MRSSSGALTTPTLRVPRSSPCSDATAFPAAVDRSDRGAGVRPQLLAGLGQTGGARVAVKQLLAELGLEPAGLMAEGGLGDRDADRRARELLLLGDRNEEESCRTSIRDRSAL
jgi:hypothetical protein